MVLNGMITVHTIGSPNGVELLHGATKRYSSFCLQTIKLHCIHADEIICIQYKNIVVQLNQLYNIKHCTLNMTLKSTCPTCSRSPSIVFICDNECCNTLFSMYLCANLAFHTGKVFKHNNKIHLCVWQPWMGLLE